MGMLLNRNAVQDEEFSKFKKHRRSEIFPRKQETFRPSKKVNLEVLIDQGNLNISSSRYKWDVRIHSRNCTSGALKHSEEIAKCNHRPEMHPKLSPVENRTQPSVDNADHLKQNLKEHARHNKKPEELGPFLSPHRTKRANKLVCKHQTIWQTTERLKERICKVLIGF